MKSAPITRAGILHKAWPIILANAAVPTLGLVDTAILGHLGSTAELGAIALGAVIFSFVYWSFGFLRMGTTGFIAQAAGARDELEVLATFWRALLIGLALGLGLVVLQWPLAAAAFQLLNGSSDVESAARDYFLIRIWGAPATLATFALLGSLIGLAYTRLLLAIQLFLNGLNIVLDIYFAGLADMGIRGIALGTVIAEWATFLLGLLLVLRLLASRSPGKAAGLWERVVDRAKVKHTLLANSDIMLRTLSLVFGFAWFANESARFGDTVLAANHIMLQLIAFSAFFLDGYAFVLEALVGRALGARQRELFRYSLRYSSELALVTAVILAALVVVWGDVAVAALTDINAVQQTANGLLPWCALYILLAVGAFQLDGIFIGATRTREMRTASIISLAGFLLAWYFSLPLGNQGLWWSFIFYVVLRAVSLLLFFPRVDKQIAA